MLMTIMQNVWFLSRQGLTLRGYDDDDDDDEGNFTQLLKLRSVDQTDLCDRLAKKGGDKYASPEVNTNADVSGDTLCDC